LQELVSGLAADRQPIGNAIAGMSQLAGATTNLLNNGRAPLAQNITALGALSTNLADNSGTIDAFLRTLPVKYQALGTIASYGSWLNFYLCSATVTGVTTTNGSPPPTGLPVTDSRCQG
jgi:phospholipid/cholesterol/gamma-HCH transport system substrate-binding protein